MFMDGCFLLFWITPVQVCNGGSGCAVIGKITFPHLFNFSVILCLFNVEATIPYARGERES